jgi:hypothetical protein
MTKEEAQRCIRTFYGIVNNKKGDTLMNPEKIMEGISKQLEDAIKDMSKAKTIEDKVAYSEIIENLSEALGVFLEMASNMLDYGLDDSDDDEEE